MRKIYFIIFLSFLSACSEDKRVENDNDLLQITFATDWKAQAEQGLSLIHISEPTRPR